VFTKRHTRQRLVVAGLTLVALAVGAILLRGERFDTSDFVERNGCKSPAAAASAAPVAW